MTDTSSYPWDCPEDIPTTDGDRALDAERLPRDVRDAREEGGRTLGTEC